MIVKLHASWIKLGVVMPHHLLSKDTASADSID